MKAFRMKAWRVKVWRAALALTTALTLASLSGAAHAQNFARPNFNIQARTPTITPTVAPRVTINPNIAGAATGVGRITPNLRTYQGCSAANRDSDGECLNKTGSSADSGNGGTGGSSGKGKNAGQRRNFVQAVLNAPTIANRLVAEIDGTLTEAQADELARRHGLARIESQSFPLLGATVGLFRITSGRPLDTVRREFAADASVHHRDLVPINGVQSAGEHVRPAVVAIHRRGRAVGDRVAKCGYRAVVGRRHHVERVEKVPGRERESALILGLAPCSGPSRGQI